MYAVIITRQGPYEHPGVWNLLTYNFGHQLSDPRELFVKRCYTDYSIKLIGWF